MCTWLHAFMHSRQGGAAGRGVYLGLRGVVVCLVVLGLLAPRHTFPYRCCIWMRVYTEQGRACLCRQQRTVVGICKPSHMLLTVCLCCACLESSGRVQVEQLQSGSHVRCGAWQCNLQAFATCSRLTLVGVVECVASGCASVVGLLREGKRMTPVRRVQRIGNRPCVACVQVAGDEC